MSEVFRFKDFKPYDEGEQSTLDQFLHACLPAEHCQVQYWQEPVLA